MVQILLLIYEQVRECISVHNHSGHPPVIPEVAHAQASGGCRYRDPWPCNLGDVCEGSVTAIVIQQLRFIVIDPYLEAIDLGIDMTVHEQEVGPTIVIEIEKHSAPARVLGVGAKSGSNCDVGEGPVPVVMIKGRSAVGKVWADKMEAPVPTLSAN